MLDIPAPALNILSRLQSRGYEAFLVGGCVRDILMGRSPHDWDITTNAAPAEIVKAFEDYKVIETGLKHGTVTVLSGGEGIEVTTYRMDGVYADHRRPESVSFTKSVKEDLARRDFTINAICYSPQSGFIDPYGGEKDIKAGVIRCVGEPDKRFEEDALRILRALRFSSLLGFEIEKDTAAALFGKKELLKSISAERIQAELTKTLCGDKAGDVLRAYAEILCVPLPELKVTVGFDQHNKHHCYDVWNHTCAVVENTPRDPVLRWAALFHDIGKPETFSRDKNGEGHFYSHALASKKISGKIMHRLKFDNRTRERILLLVEHHDILINKDEKGAKRLLARFGAEVVLQLLALARADNLGQAQAYRHRLSEYDRLEAFIRKLIADGACLSIKDLTVDGSDIKSLGYRGENIGKALNILFEAVVEDKVGNEREALLAYLSKIKI